MKVWSVSRSPNTTETGALVPHINGTPLLSAANP